MPPLTQIRAVASSGATISFAQAGDPTRPTVVLIHGYPDTKGLWDLVAERLARTFHVVAYDVRGAGDSTAPRQRAAYDLERLADDFVAVRRAVTDAPVHLVGHDWGGIQGWDFVTSPRLEGMIASFTSVAGPPLAGGPAAGLRPSGAAGLLRLVPRVRRSWYIVPLCLPGGPTLAWRNPLAFKAWRAYLEAEGATVDDHYPAATLARDGLNGANLYRQNIGLAMLGRIERRERGQAHAPVQLLIPADDRFIAPSYYDGAERIAPALRRGRIPGSHWAPRTQPDLLARCIAAFAAEHPAGGRPAD